MEIQGSKELIQQVRDRGLCVACGGCVDICPYHKAYRGKVATIFECDRKEGQCYAVCPFTGEDRDALSDVMFGTSYQETGLGFYRAFKAARAGDRIRS